MRSTCRLCAFLRQCFPESSAVLGLEVVPVSGIFGTKGITDAPAFCLTGDHSGPIQTGTVVLPVYDSETCVSGRHTSVDRVDIRLVQHWLDLCDELHPQCGSDPASQTIHSSVPGLRFIDCLSTTLVPATFSTADYATLSYVWGSSASDSTTLQPGIQLPQLITDTILLVQKLGIRYLWIDRYCIPQEDPHAKQVQIQKMGEIYSNSKVTIIAAAGTGPDHGLPGIGPVHRKPIPQVRVGRYCLTAFTFPVDEVANSVWNSRGWTYQEAILSKRRLVFTPSHVVFECLGMHCNDALSVPLRPLHSESGFFDDLDELNFGKLFPSAADFQDSDTILDRINEYSIRNLTVQTDALDAITGVFATYRKAGRPVRFLCGLPIFARGPRCADAVAAPLVVALSWVASDVLVRNSELELGGLEESSDNARILSLLLFQD
ncbi:hypothetical protein ACJ41O_003182 [Fusarium nematophilum]